MFRNMFFQILLVFLLFMQFVCNLSAILKTFYVCNLFWWRGDNNMRFSKKPEKIVSSTIYLVIIVKFKYSKTLILLNNLKTVV